jgi:hypothetical protein
MRRSQSSPRALNQESTSASTGIVTSIIISTSSGIGSRQCARSKNSLVSGGISLVSISSSVIASIRSQSVLEPFVEFPSLTSLCLPQRDDADRLGIGFTENDNHHTVVEQADADPTILAVILAVIEPDQHGSAKHTRGLGKIKAVPPDVEPILRRVPCESPNATMSATRRLGHLYPPRGACGFEPGAIRGLCRARTSAAARCRSCRWSAGARGTVRAPARSADRSRPGTAGRSAPRGRRKASPGAC